MSHRGLVFAKPTTIVDVARLAMFLIDGVERDLQCELREAGDASAGIRAITAIDYYPNVLARHLVQQRNS